MKLHSLSAGKRLTLLALSAVWSALMLAGQVGLAFLPNIEIVSLLLIVFAYVFGRWVFVTLPVFILAEGLVYGFGMWWFIYLYIWAILAVAAIALRRFDSPAVWALVSGLFGLFFGFFCSFVYLFTGGFGAMFGYWVAGLLFDLIHGVSNFVLAIILFYPLTKLMKYLAVRAKLLQ